LPITWAIFALNKNYFELDFRLIRELGAARNFREFQAEIEGFRFDYGAHGGAWRKILRLRVSGRRLINLLGKVLPQRSRHDAPASGRT
jgi:hypothetical protein